MAFTAQELAHAANAVLDYYMSGPFMSQSIQERPLLKALEAKKKAFPGGKEFISVPVKGVYSGGIKGYTHDDTVTYYNPANGKRAVFPWREVHDGINLTLTELKKEGISVVDSTTGEKTTEHSEREKFVLTGILDDKIEDLLQSWDISFNEMCWRDGTQDAKLVPGILSFVLDDPTAAGQTAGIDRVANDWWRNRASLGINSGTPSNQNLINTLEREWLQLNRYKGGKPTDIFAGSDFIDAYAKELRSKGDYTNSGFAGKKADGAMGELAFKGMSIVYDPTLDDLGRAKYCYMLDLKNIQLRPMEGEDRKRHNPARPADQYVLYRAMTWTGGMTAKMLRSSGVYSIA